ncbi:MerR family transcriptional regulator [Neobacillus sp. PS2-9]|uniref:MerR family transcriptional regulator n=1 Tax=Neobacillus sp. PS2-9 TaxID=3070676 RepID=UPI0027DFEB24|nr:MerR family transcriptional regulator [Neobacillus sp. PS2-9]WML60198.1 MerR family transcriptional regulator [Neobacillus sp. PS2-9]
MNTSEVAKSLGVSSSTIQRWVKQLELPMEKNDRGHYHFSNEDINLLKKIHEELQTGTLLHDITPVRTKKSARKGAVKAVENEEALEKVWKKVNELELGINSKADSVASYQLLQHRSDIEELQSQVNELTSQLRLLQEQLAEQRNQSKKEKTMVIDSSKERRKRKNMIGSLFGF